ncbi:MAG: nucleotidyltransferase family protein [Oscillospiraceae bacterium]
MSVAGIIAEYNPFHNGHFLQIEQLHALGYDTVVCVMSPSVVQRGEGAIFPTEVRVRSALLCGCDLVLCMPAPYAICSAEGFAKAGVRILTALGCVDALCFGMEANSVKSITDIADYLCTDEFKIALQSELSGGTQYAVAAEKALHGICEDSARILRTPNNILASEYCKAIKLQSSSLTPIGIRRVGAVHDGGIDIEHNNVCQSPKTTAEIKANIASASALRKELVQKGIDAIEPYVPPLALKAYQDAISQGAVLSLKSFEMAVLSRLRMLSADALCDIRGANEGLNNRLYAAVQAACSLDELYALMKSKRYAHARMRRLALDAALGYTYSVNIPVPYVHVLGATEKGRALLKIAKDTHTLPMDTSLANLAKLNTSAMQIANAHSTAEAFTALCLSSPRNATGAYTDKIIMV